MVDDAIIGEKIVMRYEFWFFFSAIEEFVSEENPRRIIIYYLIVNCDLHGGKQGPKKPLKREKEKEDTSGDIAAHQND